MKKIYLLVISSFFVVNLSARAYLSKLFSEHYRVQFNNLTGRNNDGIFKKPKIIPCDPGLELTSDLGDFVLILKDCGSPEKGQRHFAVDMYVKWQTKPDEETQELYVARYWYEVAANKIRITIDSEGQLIIDDSHAKSTVEYFIEK